MKNKSDTNLDIKLFDELESNAETDSDIIADISNNDTLLNTSAMPSIVSSYLTMIGQYKLLTSEEEKILFKKYKSGDMAAGEQILLHNLRLVVSIARRYARITKSLSLEDVIMDGNIGLMTALSRFEPNKGFKFSTYATWWIKQSILRSIMNNDNAIRIPVHLMEKFLKADKEIKKSEDEYNRKLTSLEIENIFKKICSSEVSYKHLWEMYELRNIASLDVSIGDGEGKTDTFLVDMIPSDEAPVEDIVISSVDSAQLWDIISSKLTPRELEVIKRRFGYSGTCETLEMIAQDYGVTRERIRQIEAKAIKKLRMSRRILKNYIETSKRDIQ